MTFASSYMRIIRRRATRKSPRADAEIVFKTFVRALERLREAPRGAGASTREKA
jgi:hypothetical protein